MKTAIALISFNRPEYLKKTVKSLATNYGIEEGVDCILFQDNAVNKFSGIRYADDKQIQESLEIFNNSTLPNKRIILREANIGIAMNQYTAANQLFYEDGYEQMILLEDDLVTGTYWLKTMKTLFEQFKDDQRIGTIRSANGMLCRPEEAIENLDRVVWGCGHWWGAGWWKDRWDKAKPHFDQYYELVKDIDYRKRPGEKIYKFFADNDHSAKGTSQDEGKQYAFSKAGYNHIRTVVNRVKGIGRIGVHFNPKAFASKGFDGVELHNYEEDKDITRFRLE